MLIQNIVLFRKRYKYTDFQGLGERKVPKRIEEPGGTWYDVCKTPHMPF